MPVVWPYFCTIDKCMLDRDIISPTSSPPSIYNFSCPNTLYWSTGRSDNIDSEMTPKTHIPSVIIGRSPEYTIDSAHGSITRKFWVVGSCDSWERHLTLWAESAPCFFPTAGFCYFSERVYKSALSGWNPKWKYYGYPKQYRKKKFFHKFIRV